MDITDLISSDGIIPNLRVTSKKQLLQELARKASALTGVDAREVFEVLLERERLGTTGVGHGIAIPHGKLPKLDKLHAVFARLDKPVDFDSIDDEPVDLVVLLLAPEAAGADHLKALARVSRMLRDRTVCTKLRGCETTDAIYALFSAAAASHAA